MKKLWAAFIILCCACIMLGLRLHDSNKRMDELIRRVDMKDSLFSAVLNEFSETRTAAFVASNTLIRANNVLDEIEMKTPMKPRRTKCLPATKHSRR